mgnify:CR=1 FL=1
MQLGEKTQLILLVPLPKTDGSALTNGWNYRWVDENGVAIETLNGTATNPNQMSLTTAKLTPGLAGKKLTLWVYDTSSATQSAYDINTGILFLWKNRNLKILL